MYLKLNKFPSLAPTARSDEQPFNPTKHNIQDNQHKSDNYQLKQAIFNGNHEHVLSLLKQGKKITLESLKIALLMYCRIPRPSSLPIIKTFIRLGGCNNAIAHTELLYTAIRRKNIKLIEQLCSLPIDWNHTGIRNEAIIFVAIRLFPHSVPILCEAGANINQRNQDGLTLMHLLGGTNCLFAERPKKLKILYALGADPTLRIPNTNFTAFQWAELQNKAELANSLKTYSVTREGYIEVIPVDTVEAQIRQLSAHKIEFLLGLSEFFAGKAKELVRFSTNLPGGSECKKKILLKLVRAAKSPLIQQYRDLELDPAIKTSPHQPVLLHHKNGSTTYKTLAQIFSEIVKLPDRAYKKFHKDGTPCSMEEFFEKNAKQIVNLGVGNCFELDIIAIMCMKEYKTYFSLSVTYELLGFFGRENGDHSFIVLNRTPGSQLNDMASWGEHATICDPWYKESVNVSAQLELADCHQAKIIKHCLKHKNHLSRIFSGVIGEGHSKHWVYKHGNNTQMFFINREHQKKKEKITLSSCFSLGETSDHIDDNSSMHKK